MRACSAGGDEGGGRVGAHAAGVGASISVVAALVILRGGERQYGLVAGHDDEAHFLALQEFFDDDGAAGRSEAAAEHGGGRLDRGLGGRADHDPLAGGQPVRLDHHGQALGADVGRIEIVRRKGRVACGGNAVAPEKFLGEGLGAFEARRRPRGTEAGAAGRGEAIDDAGDQRDFGADDGQGDVFARGKFEQGVDGVGRDVDIAHLGLERRAGVARRDEDLVHARRLRAFPCQRVFTAAAADDEDFHGGPARAQWRK